MFFKRFKMHFKFRCLKLRVIGKNPLFANVLRDSIMQESTLFPGIRKQPMYLIKDDPESEEVQTVSVNKPGICTTRKTEASVK